MIKAALKTALLFIFIILLKQINCNPAFFGKFLKPTNVVCICVFLIYIIERIDIHIMSNELQRLSDNIKTLVENTRGAGKVTSENGEVHNDTRTNKAIAEFSFSSGTQNVSGMRAFNIVAVEGTKGKEGKFVLDSVDTPENQKSYQFDTVSTFKYLGTIEIINANDEHWYFDSGLLVSGTTDAELQGAIMYEVVDGVVDETKYDIVNYIGSFDNPPALINTVNGLTSSDYGRKFKLYRDDYKLHKGDLYSIEFNGNYEDCGRIFDIEGNVVTVDSMYLDPTTITEMPEKAYFSVMDKPFAGTTNPMGQAHKPLVTKIKQEN